MIIWYRRILSLVIAYTIQRILFIGFNFNALSSVSSFTALMAFIDGIRFDLCIIATINIPLMALHTLRGTPLFNNKPAALDHLISGLFAVCNIPLIVFGIVDSKLVTFTGRRISPEIFDIGGDIKDQSLGILVQFWWITIPGVAILLFFTWYNWQKDHPKQVFRIEINPRTLARSIVFALISFLLIRGGWQTKPLAPAHAFHWQPVVLSNMVLNSGMTLLRTPRTGNSTRYDDFKSQGDIEKLLQPNIRSTDALATHRGRNVVIVIIESLATEYVGFLNNGKGYTPFIDQLASKSVFFTNSFANGRRSIDAMPAIFSGIPAWRDQPFVTSPFATNETEPLPRSLAQTGYRTLFFHGAANGSMHFDVFSKLAGFDEYIGRDEYPNQGDHDGQWGIFDEPFLKFASEKLTAIPQPFFAGIFTLTSHNPFKIPERYSGKFPKGTLPIHQAIGYADYSLAEFFRQAESKPWYQNTLFIITGDHTSLSDNPIYDNLPGRFRVPIIFFDPSAKLPAVSSDKVASHVDIKPTIIDLLGLDAEKSGLFGGPLFSKGWDGRFIQFEWDTWYYRDHAIQITLKNSGQSSVFSLTDDRLRLPTPVDESNEARLRILKAARQYFSNGLMDNTWYTKK